MNGVKNCPSRNRTDLNSGSLPICKSEESYDWYCPSSSTGRVLFNYTIRIRASPLMETEESFDIRYKNVIQSYQEKKN